MLNVVVTEASGLEAKDANGYSDPYCMLGIRPAPPQQVGQTGKSYQGPYKQIHELFLKGENINNGSEGEEWVFLKRVFFIDFWGYFL